MPKRCYRCIGNSKVYNKCCKDGVFAEHVKFGASLATYSQLFVYALRCVSRLVPVLRAGVAAARREAHPLQVISTCTQQSVCCEDLHQ
jgi:hypothetical protein